MKSLKCLPTQEKNAMARTVRQSVCNELRDKYEDVDLEEVFTREYGNECKRVPLARWEIKRKIRRIVLSKEDKYLINGKKRTSRWKSASIQNITKR
jgi:hypothetical protein